MGGDWYFVGLDLGQANDYTAIAALHRAELTGAWDPVQFAYRKWVALRLRHLERIPLGMPYPEIVERVCTVMGSPELAGRSSLVVDATGVGRPVVDLLRRARLRCTMMPVLITGGERQRTEGGYYRVPKRDLITGLQVLLQSGGLQIAAGLREGAMLATEMAEMRVRVTGAGNTQYGVWREGVHDDLVLAVGLGCWGARKIYPNGPYGEEGYWRRNDQDKGNRLLRRNPGTAGDWGRAQGARRGAAWP
jgi:hypothetical protein